MHTLTHQQANRLKLAIAQARGQGGHAWNDGGVLAQLAILEGATPATLARWDAIADDDGPLTVRRLAESGNAFAEWDVEALEALDKAWKAGESKSGLLDRVREWEGDHAETEAPQGEAMVYEGKERRNAFTVAVDIKSVIFVATVIAPLLGMTQWIMSVRQDVRSATLNNIATNARVEVLETRVSNVERDYQRSKLLFCAARSGADSTRSRGLPDIGC